MVSSPRYQYTTSGPAAREPPAFVVKAGSVWSSAMLRLSFSSAQGEEAAMKLPVHPDRLGCPSCRCAKANLLLDFRAIAFSGMLDSRRDSSPFAGRQHIVGFFEECVHEASAHRGSHPHYANLPSELLIGDGNFGEREAFGPGRCP